jgi:transposase
VHRALQRQDLLPRVHLVDTGFLDAELLVASRHEFGVELLGPTRRDPRWQARDAQGFGVEHFRVDWERRQAICPEGHVSSEWTPRIDVRGNDSVYIRFKPSDCGPCPSRNQCTRSRAKYPRRSIAVRPQPQYAALQERRALETTRQYAARVRQAGGSRGHHLAGGPSLRRLRRSRYRGLERTHLGHVLTAAALNYARVADWLGGTPRSHTRQTPFAVLMAQL